MKNLIIAKRNFDKNMYEIIYNYLHSYLNNTKTIIFDIHNTIEYDNGKFDKVIFNFIKKYYKNINIILLSYDGNNERIDYNNNLLNNYSDIFKNIPKIFIKKRKKHHIIAYITKILKTKYDYRSKIMFVDDNLKNINDTNKLKEKIINLQVIHYTAHVKPKYSESGIKDIKDILDDFIFFKIYKRYLI